MMGKDEEDKQENETKNNDYDYCGGDTNMMGWGSGSGGCRRDGCGKSRSSAHVELTRMSAIKMHCDENRRNKYGEPEMIRFTSTLFLL
ncbi:Hypothetical predicted protein [Octopus vulgaris]|uniref:Uncharacterized protein n=1 Tax=Octopus vulgaris TaxID=6645 RepID=A0AA36BR06_OCTVU|nr:Hypothetical predicted protein [Octopus vulgaris]